ncbi:hypothetical protein HDU91_006802 [Kappamyces sp. JEL0680]|nr:hypothetical protein HDU91_006802 [Kappamyces sp. JEL0680]
MQLDATYKSGPKPKTKVVIRRLPPNLPEPVFQSSVEKWSPSFVLQTAYIVFDQPDALLAFHKDYDGHVFIDSKGTQYRATVEFAPFQKSVDPAKKKRIDSRKNTLDEDAEYMAFLESLKAPSKESDLAVDKNDVEYLMSKKDEQPKVTPLLEAIKHEKAKKAAKKAKMKEKEQLKQQRETSSGGRDRSGGGKSKSGVTPLASSQVGESSTQGDGKKKSKKGRGRPNSDTIQSEPSANIDAAEGSNPGKPQSRETSSSGKKKFTLTKRSGVQSTIVSKE